MLVVPHWGNVNMILVLIFRRSSKWSDRTSSSSRHDHSLHQAIERRQLNRSSFGSRSSSRLNAKSQLSSSSKFRFSSRRSSEFASSSSRSRLNSNHELSRSKPKRNRFYRSWVHGNRWRFWSIGRRLKTTIFGGPKKFASCPFQQHDYSFRDNYYRTCETPSDRVGGGFNASSWSYSNARLYTGYKRVHSSHHAFYPKKNYRVNFEHGSSYTWSRWTVGARSLNRS